MCIHICPQGLCVHILYGCHAGIVPKSVFSCMGSAELIYRAGGDVLILRVWWASELHVKHDDFQTRVVKLRWFAGNVVWP